MNKSNKNIFFDIAGIEKFQTREEDTIFSYFLQIKKKQKNLRESLRVYQVKRF